jgi:hypothetical protein
MSEVFTTEVAIKLVVKIAWFTGEIACSLVYSVHMSWQYVRKKFSMRAGKLAEERDVFLVGKENGENCRRKRRRETVVFSP